MFDIGNEAHVEHPVGFVDHEHFAACEQYLAALEQVHQTARCRDQNVHAFFERLDLIAHLHAANQQRHRQLVIFTVFLEILGNLRGEFARRFEDQAARHPCTRTAIGEHVDHRQNEAGGLAGACLGNGDNVAHHLHLRDRRSLNRRGRVVTCFGNGF